MNDAQIKVWMENTLPVPRDAGIQITYLPTGCALHTCQSVTVEILPESQASAAFQYDIPLLNPNWKIPAFSSTLARESLKNGSGVDASPDHP
jgi:hypothetical protein